MNISARKIGLSELQIQKLEIARQRSVESLKLARRLGVKIALGSDLLGPMRSEECVELELQGQVQTPMEVLVSATKTNAELLTADRLHQRCVESGRRQRRRRAERCEQHRPARGVEAAGVAHQAESVERGHRNQPDRHRE